MEKDSEYLLVLGGVDGSLLVLRDLVLDLDLGLGECAGDLLLGGDGGERDGDLLLLDGDLVLDLSLCCLSVPWSAGASGTQRA